tara:strand:+ start:61 stop:261 length:201 start_codon:yes stop_codon:yes gene_type:complete
MQSALMTAYENTIFGPFQVIYENEEFLCIHRYARNEGIKVTLLSHSFHALIILMEKSFEMKHLLKS